MVTSWPPRHCGIATYSYDLVSALKELGVATEIICHIDGEKGNSAVHPIIDLSDPSWDTLLYQEVKKINPNLIHIQHEFGLYEHSFNGEKDKAAGLFRPLYLWKTENQPVIITYHTIMAKMPRWMNDYYKCTFDLATMNIVHEEYQFAWLFPNLEEIPKNVRIIPHGTKVISIDKEECKRKFGYSGKRVLGCIGWWEPNKGFERVIRLWPEIKKQLTEEVILVIAGEVRPLSPSGREAKEKILEAYKNSPAKDSVFLIQGAFSVEEYDQVLASFDLVALPYNQASQSGNLSRAFGLGIPALVSDLEGLAAEIERSHAGETAKVGDDEELIRKTVNLIKNPEYLDYLSRRAQEYAKDISWLETAKKHLETYKGTVSK